MKSKSNPTSMEERMRVAREVAAVAKEKERLKDEAYFKKISTGPTWKLFQIFSFYCLALALLITVETVFDGDRVYLTQNERVFYEGAVNVQDDWYLPYYVELTGYLDTSMAVVHSPIFGAPKYLRWVSKYEDSKTPVKFTEYSEWRYNSVYSYFVFIQFVLLIPIFMVWYKRPSPLFKFGRMLCLVLIFPASIFLLFVTLGIVNLLPVNF